MPIIKHLLQSNGKTLKLVDNKFIEESDFTNGMESNTLDSLITETNSIIIPIFKEQEISNGFIYKLNINKNKFNNSIQSIERM